MPVGRKEMAEWDANVRKRNRNGQTRWLVAAKKTTLLTHFKTNPNCRKISKRNVHEAITKFIKTM